jgi:hypothetical protein
MARVRRSRATRSRRGCAVSCPGRASPPRSPIEDIWDGCLWNGYRPQAEPRDPTVRFVAYDPEWLRRLTASQLRFNSLGWGILGIVRSFIDSGEMPALTRRSAPI